MEMESDHIADQILSGKTDEGEITRNILKLYIEHALSDDIP